MDDVYLEGATPEGPAMVGHLSVIVDTEGITFLGPEPGERRTVGWDRTSPLEFGPPASLPGGQAVTSLEFVVDGRPLRLLVPSKRDPGDGEGALAEASAESAIVAPPVAPVAAPVVALPSSVLAEPLFAEPLVAEPPAAPVAARVAEIPAPLVTEPPVAPAAAPVAAPPSSVLAEPLFAEPVLAEPPAAPVAARVVEIPAPVPEPLVTEPPAAPVAASVVEIPAPVPDPLVTEPPAAPVAARVAEIPAPVPEPLFAEPLVTEPVLTEPVLAAPPAAPVAASVAEVPAPVAAVVDTSGYRRERWSTDPDDEEVDEEATDEADLPTEPRVWFRPYSGHSRQARRPALSPSQRMLRLILVTVLVGLVPMAAGVWYFHLQPLPTRPAGHFLSDAAIAARVGIQPGDLPGWSAEASRMGNPFAAGATSHGAAALRTAQQSSTVLARCLHVPLSAVDGAFGMGSAVTQRTAQVTSPAYADPSGNGGAVGSVVDVVKSPQIQQADSDVFQDPSLFATCYQPFVQAMLPYASGGGSSGFATATVQPVVVPVPDGPETVQVAAFQIARIGNGNGQTTTVVTTAIAVFAGRAQATLGTVSNFVFSLDAQNRLVRDVEIRTIGVSQL